MGINVKDNGESHDTPLLWKQSSVSVYFPLIPPIITKVNKLIKKSKKEYEHKIHFLEAAKSNQNKPNW